METLDCLFQVYPHLAQAHRECLVEVYVNTIEAGQGMCNDSPWTVGTRNNSSVSEVSVAP